MPHEKNSIMGLFKTEEETISAIQELESKKWKLESVHSPVPSHNISDALKLKKSRVGWFTLTGGITGFFTGFTLAIFTAEKWSLIVSGKPVISLIPFFIVGFEFTILFAVFGNVIGLITQAGLPRFKQPGLYDPACSGSEYGVVVSSSGDKIENIADFFSKRGARIKTQ